MNTPGGNTISTAELTFSMLMALARNIPQANSALHQGEWNRKKYTGVEFFNKTLGVVGLAVAVPVISGVMLTSSAAMGRGFLGERVSPRSMAAIGLLLRRAGLYKETA